MAGGRPRTDLAVAVLRPILRGMDHIGSLLGLSHRAGMLLQLPVGVFGQLAGLCREIRTVPSRQQLVAAWQPLDESLLLLDGLMLRHVPDRRGRRQMVGIQVPGDFVDLHGLPLGRLDHDISTSGEAVLAVFPHAGLREAVRGDGDLARWLWRLTLIDSAMHRHWTFRLGRLRAFAGLANFLCEIEMRLRLCGRATGASFDLPLTQPDLADICGLSAIHVNRVLRELREAGLCTMREGRVAIHDLEGLWKAGEFDPAYLYIEGVKGRDAAVGGEKLL